MLWCCVFCWWCGVVRLGMRKTSPCVDSKRLRVCVQDASVCTGQTPAWTTHAGVFSVHTERFESTHGGAFRLLSLSLLSVCPSFSSPLLSSPLFSSLPLSRNDDNDHSSSQLSLCVHTALTCLSVRVPVLWLIPCLANMFVSCKKQLSWFY